MRKQKFSCIVGDVTWYLGGQLGQSLLKLQIYVYPLAQQFQVWPSVLQRFLRVSVMCIRLFTAVLLIIMCI